MADANEVVVSSSGNHVRSLTQEELQALTSDLQEVLIKHNAEMGVTSTISLMRVVSSPNEPEKQDSEPEDVPDGGEETKEEADTETESSS